MRSIAEAGLVHLRLVVPSAEVRDVMRLLHETPSVVNVAHLAGACSKPEGDLVLGDIPREEASVLVERLVGLGLAESGSISIEDVETIISTTATRAAEAARGSAADAVVWEEVEAITSESAQLSASFVAFMILAMLIAAVGILTDSQILIIGAMVVGPEFGPLAGLCVALVQRRLELARRSTIALLVGFPLAIALTFAATEILRWAGPAPDAVAAQDRPATFFISHPDTFSVLVALLAGFAGLLSLTTAKSGALLGVLISVTTIPAAANVGVAAAYRDWSEVGGALAQLGINLSCIVLAGVAALLVQRRAFTTRVQRAAA